MSAVALAALTACGTGTMDGEAPGATPGSVNFGGGGPPFLDRIVDAHFVQSYRGVQRVELPNQQPALDYREEVGSNGAGQFAVDPLEMLSAHPDEDLFLGLASIRAGLTFRYRGFRISDIDLFQQNYVVEVQKGTPHVAGIACVRLRAERVHGSNGDHYLVDVDPVTGLVLRWQELDDIGAVLARVGFETFAYDVDVSDMPLQDHLFATQSFSPAGDLESSLGFDVLVPALPPTGYVLDRVELMSTDDGDWAKLQYTDGLERVFLLHQAQDQSGFQGNASAGTVCTGGLGRWSLVDGNVQGFEVILAGKVAQDDLLDMLKSAL